MINMYIIKVIMKLMKTIKNNEEVNIELINMIINNLKAILQRNILAKWRAAPILILRIEIHNNQW